MLIMFLLSIHGCLEWLNDKVISLLYLCVQLSGSLFALQNQEYLPDVGHVSRDVELCTGVKVILIALYRWTQSLVLHSAMQRKGEFNCYCSSKSFTNQTLMKQSALTHSSYRYYAIKSASELYLRFHHSLLYSDDGMRPSKTFHLHWSIR